MHQWTIVTSDVFLGASIQPEFKDDLKVINLPNWITSPCAFKTISHQLDR